MSRPKTKTETSVAFGRSTSLILGEEAGSSTWLDLQQIYIAQSLYAIGIVLLLRAFCNEFDPCIRIKISSRDIFQIQKRHCDSKNKFRSVFSANLA